MDEFNIVARDLELPVTALSGGNQQKVLIARCLMRSPIAAAAGRTDARRGCWSEGGDLRDSAKARGQGIGILFTSSEIEETRALADRVLVLCQGRISAGVVEQRDDR